MFDEHELTGSNLQGILDYLSFLEMELACKYGFTSTDCKKCHQAINAINAFRSTLDNRVCGEFPNKPDREVVSVYYGNTQQQSQLEIPKRPICPQPPLKKEADFFWVGKNGEPHLLAENLACDVLL